MSTPTVNTAAVPMGSERFYLKEEHHVENGTLLGFWLYLMSDCLIFACLSMFWHFLDVIWIGVFTFVYLMGVLP